MPAANIVVQAGEAEVADGTQFMGSQALDELVVAGGGDLRGTSLAGRRQSQQTALFEGECEEEKAFGLVFPLELRRLSTPVWHRMRMDGWMAASIRTTWPPFRVTFFSAGCGRGARAAIGSITSITRRRTAVWEMRLPPAMSASRWSWRR
ncbi:hypothetical protein [Streptomyces sp. NPDC102360]|uniref:hypothetical protein n=1 Tax=Streptomyces sp. NPDC102360 TaxID=3366160 RepID=UPI003818FCA2